MWTTRDEVQFMRGMGTGSFLDRRAKAGAPSLEDRLALLKKYRETLERRSIWNGMSQSAVKLETDQEIRKVEAVLKKKEMK